MENDNLNFVTNNLFSYELRLVVFELSSYKTQVLQKDQSVYEEDCGKGYWAYPQLVQKISLAWQQDLVL